jgi:hypothetical protein
MFDRTEIGLLARIEALEHRAETLEAQARREGFGLERDRLAVEAMVTRARIIQLRWEAA